MAKIGIIYWSGSGNTEKMAELMAKGAAEAGAEVVCKHVASASQDELSGYDVVAFGSPSMGAEVVEESEMEPFVNEAVPGLKGKKAALFGSYGWGDGEWMRNWDEECSNLGADMACDYVICNETPDDDGIADCKALGGALV